MSLSSLEIFHLYPSLMLFLLDLSQIGDLTQDLCSCQAEKKALVAARETSDVRVQRLMEDLQQAQDGLERALGTETQLETLRADAQHWVQEKEQLLESVETLKQEVSGGACRSESQFSH